MIQSPLFAVLNVGASLVIGVLVAHKLVTKVEMFTPMERIGMGFTAAGGLMTIAPVLSPWTPYNDWAGTLMRLGMALYFVGRQTRHRYNNWVHRRQALKQFEHRRPKETIR